MGPDGSHRIDPADEPGIIYLKDHRRQNLRDLRLVRRIIGGDERALDQVYARYAELLFAFIVHRMNGERADAEDVWQETLLAAFDTLPAWRGESRLFTWMCGIARHKMADHFRRRDRAAIGSDEAATDHMPDISPSDTRPEQILIRNTTRAVVIETLAALPELHRTVLTARYAEEMSITEVAEMIHRSYKATESLLSRARSAFRETFEKLEELSDGD